KFLGLGYPGGPLIDRLAPTGNPRAFTFSITKISDGSLDFSFSGFKTAALRQIEQAGIRPVRSTARAPQAVIDLGASYQHAIVQTLLRQPSRAAERLQPRSILLVGGVACNSLLRRVFSESFERVYYPSPALTTDNAAMIAAAGTPILRSNPGLALDLNAY